MNEHHTPSPWQINHHNPDQVCDADGEVRGCSPIATLHGTARERRANGRLIVTAPRLLDALFDALPYIEDVLADPRQLACFKKGVVEAHAKQIRDLIAEATGDTKPSRKRAAA